MTDQWLRKVTLVVSKDDKGIDLSSFHIKFNIEAADIESPNNATIRVYNMSPETVAKIKGEFSQVSLSAGYQYGNFGLIFKGEIMQFRTGKEDALTSYFDILAADGDIAYNQGFINKTLGKGATPSQILDELAKSMNDSTVQKDQLKTDLQHFPMIRSSVYFGMSRALARNVASTLDASWSIQNGQVVVTPMRGYDPSHVVELNARTGLIGVPEQAEDGIHIRCLLNPRLRVGGTVKINNKSLNQLSQQGTNVTRANSRTQIQNNAALSDDGTYRVFVLDHEGDTRGNQWYTNIIGLAVDQSAPADKAVRGD